MDPGGAGCLCKLAQVTLDSVLGALIGNDLRVLVDNEDPVRRSIGARCFPFLDRGELQSLQFRVPSLHLLHRLPEHDRRLLRSVNDGEE